MTLSPLVINAEAITATHGIDPDTVQRMLTAKSKGQSGKATILSGIVGLPIVCSFIPGTAVTFFDSICFPNFDSDALRSK